MPLHFGKIARFVVLLTIIAFVLWLVWSAFFAGETVDEPSAAALPRTIPAAAQLTLAG